MKQAASSRPRPSMVGWYDPPILVRSALNLTLANLFGRHSDTRLIEALASQPQGYFDYRHDEGELWIDYVADIGDGWNPTCGIAHAIAAKEQALQTAAGEHIVTRGGRLLIFGGDEVYPYPSRLAYEQRTEAPYTAAFQSHGRWPELFAIPGNHDWYDSLVAFTRAFCRPERGFAGCRTQQTRSYFALRLPADWWLLGIDLQLGAEFDEPQVQYFQTMTREFNERTRVIMAVPDPQWIYANEYPEYASYEDATLRFFEEQVIKRAVDVYVTGDLHLYQRHANAAGTQKIVSGGGGAFLHPTHAPDASHLADGFERKAIYPPPEISRRLSWRNLLLPLLNPASCSITAVLYSLSAWFAAASIGRDDVVSFGAALAAALGAAVRSPFNGLWLMLFLAAFVFFTDTHARWYRLLGGLGHAAAHLFGAFCTGWLAIIVTTRWLELPFGSAAQFLASVPFTLIGGALLGPLILGIYLLISLNVFGRHSTEAFSSLRIQDYKQWLRMRIDAAGNLDLYAIALDRVPRHWREMSKSGAVEPDDPLASAPRLVDYVRVPGRAGRGN
ncbi:MAG: hypothetical protein R3E77_01150 [Steroidobacteraceae bacterium]